MKKYTLKELREKNKWTLEEVGEKMGGVSRQMVFMWESGKNNLTLPIIIDFLKLYDVKFEQVKWIISERKTLRTRKK